MTKYLLISDISNAKNLLDIVRNNNLKIVGQYYAEDFRLMIVANKIDCLKVNFGLKIEEIEKSKVFYDKNIEN